MPPTEAFEDVVRVVRLVEPVTPKVPPTARFSVSVSPAVMKFWVEIELKVPVPPQAIDAKVPVPLQATLPNAPVPLDVRLVKLAVPPVVVPRIVRFCVVVLPLLSTIHF